MDNFYKVSEVAKIFKVKPITIRKWCQSGNISAKKFGKSWYIYKDELVELMNSSKKNSNNNGSVKAEYL
jgi:excisionase family DNA binding protein